MYRAIDRNKGREVAWNEIKLDGDINLEKLAQEIEILRLLKGEYFISFYNHWIDDGSMTLVFITEIMDSGTLRRFAHKLNTIIHSSPTTMGHFQARLLMSSEVTIIITLAKAHCTTLIRCSIHSICLSWQNTLSSPPFPSTLLASLLTFCVAFWPA